MTQLGSDHGTLAVDTGTTSSYAKPNWGGPFTLLAVPADKWRSRDDSC